MDKLIIDQTYDEQLRVAVIDENNRLQHISIEQLNRQTYKGNIYVGRVLRVEKSLNAAFVDVGIGGKAGFLQLDDVLDHEKSSSKTPDRLLQGDLIAVQVLKDGRGQKGPALTSDISLSGHYTVLAPYATSSGIGISKRIGAPAERKRLKAVIEQMKLPEGVQIIVRTASVNQDVADIKKDIRNLLKLWKIIQDRVHISKGPELIYEEGNAIYKALKNYYTKDIEVVLVEGSELYRTTRKFMKSLVPTHVNRVQLWPQSEPLFYHFHTDEHLENILNPVVQLPSGGNIVIHMTEAMCAIDVNSAHAHGVNALLVTNKEAAEEVARQVRLRNIAGIIAIDFIETENLAEDNEEIYKLFKAATKPDKAHIEIAKINEFGVLMFTRQRIQLGLNDSHMTTCPQCQGYGIVRSPDTMSIQILKALERMALQNQKVKVIKLFIHPIVGEHLLNQKRQALVALERYFNMNIHIVYDLHMDLSHYKTEVQNENLSHVKQPSSQ